MSTLESVIMGLMNKTLYFYGFEKDIQGFSRRRRGVNHYKKGPSKQLLLFPNVDYYVTWIGISCCRSYSDCKGETWANIVHCLLVEDTKIESEAYPTAATEAHLLTLSQPCITALANYPLIVSSISNSIQMK